MSERRSGTLTLLNCIFSEASCTIVFLLAFFVSINVTICCFQGLQGEKGEKVTNIVLEFAAAEGAHTMFSVKYSYLV